MSFTDHRGVLAPSDTLASLPLSIDGGTQHSDLKRRERVHRRLAIAFSLAVHALLLSLTFGGEGLGLAGSNVSKTDRTTEASQLQVVTLASQASGVSQSDAAAKAPPGSATPGAAMPQPAVTTLARVGAVEPAPSSDSSRSSSRPVFESAPLSTLPSPSKLPNAIGKPQVESKATVPTPKLAATSVVRVPVAVPVPTPTPTPTPIPVPFSGPFAGLIPAPVPAPVPEQTPVAAVLPNANARVAPLANDDRIAVARPETASWTVALPTEVQAPDIPLAPSALATSQVNPGLPAPLAGGAAEFARTFAMAQRERADADARQKSKQLEADRQDAANAQAAAQEIVRQEAAKQEAVRAEATRQEATRQELARQDAARREAANQEAARQETARQEATRQEAVRLDAVRADIERQTAAKQAAARLAATQHDAARAESERAQRFERIELERQAATKQLLAQQDLARQEAARVDAARQEVLQKEAVRQEFNRQEAVRAETARQESARQEAARQETAAAQAKAESARRDAERAVAAQQAAATATAVASASAPTSAPPAPSPVSAPSEGQSGQAGQAAQEGPGQGATRQEAARMGSARTELLKVEAARLAALQAEAQQREERLRAIGRQLNEEADRRNAAAAKAERQSSDLPYSVGSARRGRIFGRTDANAELVAYAEAWGRKIQQNMAFDSVREAAKQRHNDAMVTVAVRSDGSVESVTFVRSSGVPAIDEAIRNIVQTQANYQAFSPALERDYDVIEIRRTWHFDMSIRLY